jgi:hypoxanthine phosphoribosyltransferase
VEEAVREFVADILARQSEMSWDLFLQQIEWLNERTNRSDEYEDGLRPHVVIGVNMGGMLAGSLLYYKNRSRFHLMTVWTKDESMYRKLAIRQRDFQEELRQVVGQIRDRGDKPRILLIDDSDKSGEAMNQALQLTKAVVPDACVKTGALVYLGPPNGRPDYCQLSDYQRFKYAPV